ncbi:MAG TPA: ABC transporter permease [Solirubrobacteraceae bacterium]|nr:ABC transporter permease [Solirubrobacteraceae bacterium]
MSAARQLAARLRSDRLGAEQRWLLALVAILIAELLFFDLSISGFWSGSGSSGWLGTETFTFTSIIALGVMFVIFTGDIDLSVGALAGFSGIVMGELNLGGMNIWLAVVIALAVSAGIGLLQGVIITAFKLESLLVTLAGQFILGASSVAYEGAVPPSSFPHGFVKLLGSGTVLGLPNQLLIFAVLAVISVLLVHRTRFGRQLVLVGHNREAAAYTGVRVSLTRIRAFTLSGLFAGIAGVIIAATFNSVTDYIGTPLLLPAITAVVLGGVNIFGGSGRVPGVIVATFILGLLTIGLLDDGVGNNATSMATGVLLLGALTVKGVMDRRQGLPSIADRLRGRFPPATAPGGAADAT